MVWTVRKTVGVSVVSRPQTLKVGFQVPFESMTSGPKNPLYEPDELLAINVPFRRSCMVPPAARVLFRAFR